MECQLSQQTTVFLSPWTGGDNKGEGCGERKKRKRKSVSDGSKFSKEDLRGESFGGFFAFLFEFELVCLDHLIFVAVRILCGFFGTRVFLLFVCMPVCFEQDPHGCAFFFFEFESACLNPSIFVVPCV